MLEGLFQPLHLFVVLMIVLIVFGPGRLPELGESLGKSIREFKKGLADAESSPSRRAEDQEQITDRT